jgi:predicted enzyme related to lactoylglutathione lyase
MSDALRTTVQHVGLCTADLDRAVGFYTGAFGFKLDYSIDVDPAYDTLTELPGMKCRTAFLQHEAFRLELISYRQPEVIGQAERRPMHQLGLTHFCMVVSDLDAVSGRIAALGGRLYPETQIETPHGRFVFCTDPDGVRIELWEKRARPSTGG